MQIGEEEYEKKEIALIAFVFGICVTVCSGTIVLSAQEQTEKENGEKRCL